MDAAHRLLQTVRNPADFLYWTIIINLIVLAPSTSVIASKPLSNNFRENQSLQSFDWTVQISNDYQIVGPFPQEAREQHYISPGYPLGTHITLPFNRTKSFASHLVDEGWVQWSNVSLLDRRDQSLAHYSVSFPRVRWDTIRATEGWSGLQHHALLHTKITLVPPLSYSPLVDKQPPYLLLSASQCSYLALLDPTSDSVVPRWYTGNIYAYSDAPAIRIPLNHAHPASGKSLNESALSSSHAIELDLLMSLDYEIRLFGDPTVFKNNTTPTIQAELQAMLELENSHTSPEAAKTHPETPGDEQSLMSMPNTKLEEFEICVLINKPGSQIVPHFVDGWAYGDVVGIEVTSCSHQYLNIDKVATELANYNPSNQITFTLVEPIRLAPSQTRTIALKIDQAAAISSSTSTIAISLYFSQTSDTRFGQFNKAVQTTIDFVHHPSLSALAEDARGVLMTYYSVSNITASAVLLPPVDKSQLAVTSDTRILLALHGAGVMHTNPVWISALPRPEHTWVLVVQGLTPWGLDWREASRADVCAALRALVLRLVGSWNEEDYCTPHDEFQEVMHHAQAGNLTIPVIAIGHSNGGQGTLHLASQFPDSIPALIPAAGYTSARLYVSTEHSRGSLFADAALQGILRASLQGQDGDVIAGNLVLSQVRLVHGGDDENVPVWHSRERMALVKTWDANADVSLTEVPGKPHFWSSIFKEEPVASAITELIASPYANLSGRIPESVLTVVWPSDSGSMHGWRVRELTVPGRISRIRVYQHSVRTTNVHGISINLRKAGLIQSSTITIDNQRVSLPATSVVWLRRDETLKWTVAKPFKPYPSGPLSKILTSPKTIAIIIPHEQAEYYESIALRLAHSLYTYLKLDCEILQDHEAMSNDRDLQDRSIVVVGGQLNQYGMSIRASPLKVFPEGLISIGGFRYGEAGTAAISLYENHLYMDAVDQSGYEQALRIFPLRTGVPGPEWIIVGAECEAKGYGGILAAGFWNRTGGLGETMSYFT